jgi:hypothetical protein
MGIQSETSLRVLVVFPVEKESTLCKMQQLAGIDNGQVLELKQSYSRLA